MPRVPPSPQPGFKSVFQSSCCSWITKTVWIQALGQKPSGSVLVHEAVACPSLSPPRQDESLNKDIAIFPFSFVVSMKALEQALVQVVCPAQKFSSGFPSGIKHLIASFQPRAQQAYGCTFLWVGKQYSCPSEPLGDCFQDTHGYKNT